MERFSMAAAWSERGEQRAGTLGPVMLAARADRSSRLAPTMASAVTTAASQSVAVVSGDHPTRSTPGGHATSPLGS